LAAAVTLGSATAYAQALNLFAVLRGPNELAAGDTNSSGTAMISFRGVNLTTICVVIYIDATDTPRATPNGAHVHRGGASVDGPVVIPLISPTSGNAAVSRTCRVITAALSAELRSNPAAFYVNIHTNAFTAGAMRGQLF
jgi:hypothetical protein